MVMGGGFDIFEGLEPGGRVEEAEDEKCEYRDCDGVARTESFLDLIGLTLCRPHLEEAHERAVFDDRVLEFMASKQMLLAAMKREDEATYIGELFDQTTVASRMASKAVYAWMGRSVRSEGFGEVAE